MISAQKNANFARFERIFFIFIFFFTIPPKSSCSSSQNAQMDAGAATAYLSKVLRKTRLRSFHYTVFMVNSVKFNSGSHFMNK